jgi:hypothetical protein
MAFKILHHPQKGVLTFLRVYSGTLSEGDTVYNATLDRSEKVTRLYIVFAEDFRSGLYVRITIFDFHRGKNFSAINRPHHQTLGDLVHGDLVPGYFITGYLVPGYFVH